uniref:Uncharacterized protein n=1 Tax=Parascaris equorum TaxID=6256 RepID=A0A914RK60_PAREQ
MDADGKLSSTESVEEHNPLKRPLAIDRNPVMMKYSAQVCVSLFSMSAERGK